MARTSRNRVRIVEAPLASKEEPPKVQSQKPREKPHLGLTPQCGICGTVMVVGEKCTVLLGTNRATEYQRHIAAFEFPKYGLFHGEWGLEDDTLLCRNPECTKGTASLEACTVHVDCLNLFRQHCAPDKDDALDRLWIAAAWRRPWRQVPWLWLDPSDSPMPMAWLADAASGGEHDSLSRLAVSLQHLPPEIVQMIRLRSAQSLLWRYGSVLGQARHLASRTPPEEFSSMPLRSIAAWKRGNPPDTTDTTDTTSATSAAHLPIIRLTVDARGLRTVERLPSRPPPRSWRSHTEAFVVVDESQIQDVMVLFKFGHARLELPPGTKGLQVWDTPTPPALSACRLHLKAVKTNMRFQTLPLDRADGVTLFFQYAKIVGIHMHTPSTPIAQMTSLCLDPPMVVWVYVPFAANDRVLAFGTRRSACDRGDPDEEEDDDADADADDDGYSNPYRYISLCFLFRTQLAGDVSAGPLLSGPFEDTHLACAPPVTLVCSGLESGILSVAGAYETSPPAVDPKPVVPFAPPRRQPLTADDHLAFMSSAPLDRVVHVRVFSDKDYGFSRGILLEYENGGQRALGQCRVGVDPASDYARPVCLCVQRSSFTYIVEKPAPREPGTQNWRVIYAEAAYTHDHEHDGPHWDCIPLRGHLEFYFTAKDSRLTVVDEE